MKFQFWLEVLVTIFCFVVFIIDLCVGRYVLAIVMCIWFVIDLILAIILGIEVYGG